MHTFNSSQLARLSDEDYRRLAAQTGASDLDIASKGYMMVAAEALLLQRDQLADLLNQLDSKVRCMHQESLPFDLRSVCERSRQLLDLVQEGPIPVNLN